MGFSLGGESYAVAVGSVAEVVRHENVRRVPALPEFLEGVIELRGHVIPVVDLGKRFGVGAEPRSLRNIMIVETADQKIGFAVDAVTAVFRTPKDRIRPLPESLRGPRRDFLSGVFAREDQLVLLCDLTKVLSADERSALGGDEEPIYKTLAAPGK